MNVVHVFPYTPTVSGGHSNAIRSFIECQRAKGINAVGVAPPPDPGTAGCSFSFPLAEVPSLWGLRWEIIAGTFAITESDSLFNFHSVNRRFAPLLRDLRRAGVPYAFTSHGQLSFQNATRWLKKFIYLNFLNLGPRRADGLHLLTNLVDRQLKFLVPWYRGPRLVQGNVVNVPALPEPSAGLKADFGLPSDAFVLLFLGRLDVWVKGLDLLIEAFSSLPSSQGRLVLAGPDWQGGRATLEHLAEQVGCRDRVLFTGPVYGERKWSLLRAADVFISPSRWEAFSIAQAEAMACDLPVVTSTKVNPAPDLREADAAIVVPPAVESLAKAIALLEGDPELRRTVGSRGRAWVEANCGAERAGARFCEFYQTILERRGTRR